MVVRATWARGLPDLAGSGTPADIRAQVLGCPGYLGSRAARLYFLTKPQPLRLRGYPDSILPTPGEPGLIINNDIINMIVIIVFIVIIVIIIIIRILTLYLFLILFVLV